MVGFRDFSSCSFENCYVHEETLGTNLLNRLLAENNHSQQITPSEKTLFIATLRKVKLYLSKFVAFWNGKATSLQLTVRTVIIFVTQTFLYDMHVNWKPKRPSGSSCQTIRKKLT